MWWKVEGWNPIWVEQYNQLLKEQYAKAFGSWWRWEMSIWFVIVVFALCLFSCKSWSCLVLINLRCSLCVFMFFWFDFLWCCYFCMELMDVNWGWCVGLRDKDPIFSTYKLNILLVNGPFQLCLTFFFFFGRN